jgi:hypothetical protein
VTGRETTARSFSGALHVATLWVLAVAAPLFEVLRRDPEFFVAYRATRGDVVLFATALAVVVPVALAIAVWLAGRVSWRFQRWLTWSLVLAGASLIAAPALNRLGLSTTWHLAAALTLGLAAALLYARVKAAPLFVTFLSPALVAVPLFFVLHPSMAAFVFPEPPAAVAAARVDKGAPIVLVVFDQLPLTSLMNSERTIDAAEFPGFAALARTSTWFRNASTVGELTQWALPPIVTGRYPRPGRLPVAARHPENLFTFLAGSYRMTVIEPLTALCPTSLCAAGEENGWARAKMMLADSAVVYLHIIAPQALARRLPPLTNSWKGFAASGDLGARWSVEQTRDRRRSLNSFLQLLRKEHSQPPLYFLHALLPHEPYLYLRSGQQFDVDTPLFGNLERGRWTTEEWPVVQAYRRHLLQVQYIDAYVDRLLQRLVSEGMFDETLLIVTADHGASFRPGKPFKALEDVTIRDIAPVPLFVKRPFQRQGSIDDRNVQSIDIVPTIADVLGVPLTWTPDGISMVDPDVPAASTKLVFHRGATTRTRVTPAELHADGEALGRRAMFFGTMPAPDYAPLVAPHRDLVGREVNDLAVDDAATLDVEVEGAGRFFSVDPRGPLVPSMVTGRVANAPAVRRTLAIAVNGRIAATTYTYGPAAGSGDGTWSAFVSPRFLRPGRNSISVYDVRSAAGGRVLVRGYMSDVPISAINLVSPAAETGWNVRLNGFHAPEGPERQPFRWTTGVANVVVPRGLAAETPRSLLVGLALTRPGGGRVQIALNGCKLFDGRVASAPWYRTFSLRTCALPDLTSGEARVTLESDVFRPGSSDPRQLGVAVENLRLLKEDWPLERRDPLMDGMRARIEIVNPSPLPAVLQSDAVVVVDVVNRGDHAWPAADSQTTLPVYLSVTWEPLGRGGTAQERRIDLPRTLYPSDHALVTLALDPPAGGARASEYTVGIAVARDGRSLGGAVKLQVRGR